MLSMTLYITFSYPYIYIYIYICITTWTLCLYGIYECTCIIMHGCYYGIVYLSNIDILDI